MLSILSLTVITSEDMDLAPATSHTTPPSLTQMIYHSSTESDVQPRFALSTRRKLHVSSLDPTGDTSITSSAWPPSAPNTMTSHASSDSA